MLWLGSRPKSVGSSPDIDNCVCSGLKCPNPVGGLFTERTVLPSEGVGGVVLHDSEPLVFPVPFPLHAPSPYFRLAVSDSGSTFRQHDGHDFSEPSEAEGIEGAVSEAFGEMGDTDTGADDRRLSRCAVRGVAQVQRPVSSQRQRTGSSVITFLPLPRFQMNMNIVQRGRVLSDLCV